MIELTVDRIFEIPRVVVSVMSKAHDVVPHTAGQPLVGCRWSDVDAIAGGCAALAERCLKQDADVADIQLRGRDRHVDRVTPVCNRTEHRTSECWSPQWDVYSATPIARNIIAYDRQVSTDRKRRGVFVASRC